MCLLRSLVLLHTLGALLRMLLRIPTGFGLNSRHPVLHVSSLLTPWCYYAPWWACSLSNAGCQQYISTASMHYLLRAPFGPWEDLPCRVALVAPLASSLAHPAHSLMQNVTNASALRACITYSSVILRTLVGLLTL
jgi:hypothetical protein